MESIRVGIIGAGANTRKKHIPGLQAIDGVEIISVCNRSVESSENVAKEFGIPEIREEWWDLIEDGDIDAVVIGTWPYLHCPAVVAALEAGKHVLTEARMAMNAGEAHLMLEAAREAPDLVSMIVPSPFTFHVDRTIQRLIAEGYLGDLLAIDIHDAGRLLNPDAPARFLDKTAPITWRDDADFSGMNTLTLGIWYEPLMRWVGEATRVTAMGKVFTPVRNTPDGRPKAVRIPDHLDVIADMACGAQLHMQLSKVAGLARPSEAVIYGSEGTLKFVNSRLYGARKDETELREIDVPETEKGAWRVEEEFIGAILGEEKVQYTTFEDGVKYMEFTEAVFRSMQRGESVGLPL